MQPPKLLAQLFKALIKLSSAELKQMALLTISI
jgi:hypothetical protein